MSETLKFGNGQWATKVGSTLAYNDEGGNFKPLPFNFTRSTGATRVNKDGLIEVVTNNKPRIDFLNDSNGALLLEPQRTNLNTYSEDIPQNYVTTEISDTFEYSTSPNGLQTSTRLQLSNVGSSRYVQTLTGIVSNGTTYNFSCYYKGTLGETAYMYALPVGGTAITKAITFTGEWQRENLTFTAGASSNYAYIVDSRQGGDASDFEVWGAQIEAGSYATSYIPTQGATATRVAETCIQTPPSGIIGQTEGTLFVEVNQFGGQANSPYLLASDGTFNNRIQISSGGGGTENYFTFYISVGGVNNVFYISPTEYTGVHKLAIAYKLNDVVGYIDGVQVLNDTSSTIPATTTLEIGRSPSNPLNAGINQTLLFKTRLTNAELETLTTL